MINAIRKLVKLWDDVWAMDRIWLIVKWPFGVLVAWFVLFLIVNMEVNPTFSDDIFKSARNWVVQVGQDCSNVLSHLTLQGSDPVKNVK